MATGVAFAIDAPHLLLLYFQHERTVGRVFRLVPNSHGLVDVGYSVGRTAYRRELFPYGIEAPPKVGETIPVHYYPRDPAVAATAPAGEILAGELPAWIVASLLLGTPLGIAVAICAERFARWLPKRRPLPGDPPT